MTPRVNREALSISTEAEPGLACADPFTLHDASIVRHVRCAAAKVKVPRPAADVWPPVYSLTQNGRIGRSE